MAGMGEAIIDVNGVGYLVKCGTRTLSALTEGQAARLHVETHVREQAITLFGFASEEDRAWFVRLQTVQKVGPKAALAILDIMRPEDILSAASLEDKAAFGRAKGVGPSLASRIVSDLSGKPPPIGRGALGAMPAHFATGETGKQEGGAPSHQKDAISALVNLGIGQSEALRAVAIAARDNEGLALNALVKAALKELAK